MSSDNLDEYRAKLQKSKQQLKKVKHLLTQQPHNENLLNVRCPNLFDILSLFSIYLLNINSRPFLGQLKRDLEEVITVTESLIIKKQEKAFDPQKLKKAPKPTSNHHDHSSLSNAVHDDEASPNSNIYANNPMFIQNPNLGANPEKPKKPIPREWGIKKDHYEIDERCQVLIRCVSDCALYIAYIPMLFPMSFPIPFPLRF